MICLEQAPKDNGQSGPGPSVLAYPYATGKEDHNEKEKRIPTLGFDIGIFPFSRRRCGGEWGGDAHAALLVS